MVDRKSGLRTATKDSMVVDAGVIKIGGQTIGATQDGVSFLIQQTIREPNIDGARGPIKDTRRVTRELARLTFQPKEWTSTNWQSFIAGASGNPVQRNTYLLNGAHLDVVTLVGLRSDGKDVVITLENALADSEEISASFTDEEEAAPEIQLTSHFEPTNLGGKAPWSIKIG